MALVKKYKCMNLGNCEYANSKEVFEIAEGEKLECPKCHKEMLVEVKGGLNIKLIALIVAAVVVAVVVGIGVSGGSKAGVDTDGDGLELVDGGDTVDVDEEAEDEESGAGATDGLPEKGADGGENVAVTEEPDVNEPEVIETKPETGATSVDENEQTTAADATLNWASYEGPTAGGKPHGVGGTLNVTKNYTIDLKDGKGGKINVAAGDKIKNTKFKNGKFIQGELQRKNGQRLFIEIGG